MERSLTPTLAAYALLGVPLILSELISSSGKRILCEFTKKVDVSS